MQETIIIRIDLQKYIIGNSKNHLPDCMLSFL